jgi:putative lipoprotein
MGRWALIASFIYLFSLANSAMADFRTLEGSATYRQRIALQPEAILSVELRDISRSDVPSTLLSSVSVKPSGQVPIPFKLLYDDNMIDQRHTYSVSAKISLGERVLFRSTATHMVLTRGNPNRIQVIMDMMPAASSEKHVEALFGSEWIAEDIDGGGVIDNAHSTIMFEADGKLSGSGGCNNFSGQAKVDGYKMEIGPLAATQRACVPALSDQEQKFFQAITNTRSFEIDEGREKLILKDSSGAPIVRLSKL